MKSSRNFNFNLGQGVRNKIHGFAGTIIGRSEWLFGCCSYSILPRDLDKDGKPKESHGFDEDSLEAAGENLTGKEAADFKFELGTKVKHRVHGLTGVIVGRTEWLHNSVTYSVSPGELDKDGKPRENIGFDEDALEPVVQVHKDTEVGTGGPVQSPAAVSR